MSEDELSQFEKDMLLVFYEYHPKPIGYKKIVKGLRKKGYVLNKEDIKELKEMFK